MIFDRIENINNYKGLGRVYTALEFIAKTDFTKVNIGKYELDGDYLYIYDRVLFCDHDRWGTGIIKFYSDITKTEESFVNAFHTEGYLPLDFSNEALEPLGAEYKHTFKLSYDGSYYYWVSSEPVK